MVSLIDRSQTSGGPSSTRSSWAGSSQTLGRRSSKKVRFTQSPPGLFTLLHKDTIFTLNHFQGTNPVRYDAQGWRHISYSMGRTNLATEVLRRTCRSELKIGSQDPLMSSPIGGQSGMTLEDIRAKMSCLQVKVQV